MRHELTRREFIEALSAAALLGALSQTGCQQFPRVTPAQGIVGPDGKKILRVAGIGVGSQGGNDLGQVASHPQVRVVAICDVDDKTLHAAAGTYPKAAAYTDWRTLLAEKGDQIDAVTVGIPDHMHAPVAMSALLLGKHVYCEKPLAHELFEVRALTRAAARAGVATQMGIQIHSAIEYRMARQMIQDGAIGKVSAVHVWSDRSWAARPPERPVQTEIPPAHLHWDNWIGVAPMRPYAPGRYHPGQWRGVLDFGTGSLGDMGCHIIDTPMAALGLAAPRRVRAQGPGVGSDAHALWAIVEWDYAPTPYTTPNGLTMTWYDGGKKPDPKLAPLAPGQNLPDNGAIFIGEKGVLLLPHISGPQLLPAENFRSYARPRLAGQNHYHQWVEAALGQGQPSAPFAYAGPLTETVLLGVLAERFIGQDLAWDSANLKVTNLPQANHFLRRSYREGWRVAQLS